MSASRDCPSLSKSDLLALEKKGLAYADIKIQHDMSYVPSSDFQISQFLDNKPCFRHTILGKSSIKPKNIIFCDWRYFFSSMDKNWTYNIRLIDSTYGCYLWFWNGKRLVNGGPVEQAVLKLPTAEITTQKKLQQAVSEAGLTDSETFYLDYSEANKLQISDNTYHFSENTLFLSDFFVSQLDKHMDLLVNMLDENRLTCLKTWGSQVEEDLLKEPLLKELFYKIFKKLPRLSELRVTDIESLNLFLKLVSDDIIKSIKKIYISRFATKGISIKPITNYSCYDSRFIKANQRKRFLFIC